MPWIKLVKYIFWYQNILRLENIIFWSIFNLSMEPVIDSTTDSSPSIPNFIVSKELKNGEQANIYLARELDTATPDTRQKLAVDLQKINPTLKIEKLVEQMEMNAYDVYYLTNKDGEATGYATVFPLEDGACYLNKIHTSDNHKNKGVATTILKQVMLDYDTIELVDVNTGEDGSKEGMANTYIKLGFVAGEDEKYVWTKPK